MIITCAVIEFRVRTISGFPLYFCPYSRIPLLRCENVLDALEASGHAPEYREMGGALFLLIYNCVREALCNHLHDYVIHGRYLLVLTRPYKYTIQKLKVCEKRYIENSSFDRILWAICLPFSVMQ